MIRRNADTEAIRFPEDFKLYEDWEFFAWIAKLGISAYLDCDTLWNYGHAGPRLTNADVLTAVETRLKLTERLWGQDPIFLRDYPNFYAQIVSRLHLQRAKALLIEGKTDCARRELQDIASSPIPYRLLALLPGIVTKTLLDFRRKIMRYSG